jgi:hypothetical protein
VLAGEEMDKVISKGASELVRYNSSGINLQIWFMNNSALVTPGSGEL